MIATIFYEKFHLVAKWEACGLHLLNCLDIKCTWNQQIKHIRPECGHWNRVSVDLQRSRLMMHHASFQFRWFAIFCFDWNASMFNNQIFTSHHKEANWNWLKSEYKNANRLNISSGCFVAAASVEYQAKINLDYYPMLECLVFISVILLPRTCRLFVAFNLKRNHYEISSNNEISLSKLHSRQVLLMTIESHKIAKDTNAHTNGSSSSRSSGNNKCRLLWGKRVKRLFRTCKW